MLTAQKLILNRINLIHGTTLQESDVVFGIPTLLPDGSERNSRVKVYPKAHTAITTSISSTYNRVHVSRLGAVKVPKSTHTRLYQLLPSINSSYSFDFKEADLVDYDLPAADSDGNVTAVLNFDPLCMGYYSSPEIKTPDILNVGEEDKINADTYAALDDIRSSSNCIIGNLGYSAAAVRTSVARATMSINAGQVYWETKVLAGGAIVGFGTANALMDLDGNKTLGYDERMWGLNTVTGEYIHRGIATPAIRPIAINEDIGLLLNKTTGDLTIILSDTTVTINATGMEQYGKIFPMVAGDTDIRSTIWVNFGQEPMVYNTPVGVKRGLYTLK